MPEPTAALSPVQRWRAMVEAEHAQAERMRGPVSSSADSWAPVAERFRADPRRTDDPVLQRISRFVEPHQTVMDVGAGGERYALPLALRCREVIAVEPSPAMVTVLREGAMNAGISNVTVVQEAWEQAEVSPADVVLCANVLYTIRDVEGFLRKLEAHAQAWVLMVLHVDQPVYPQVAPVWRRFHGQERLRLPGLRELMDALWSIGIYPNLEMLPAGARPYASRDEARRALGRWLFLPTDSPNEQLMEQVLDELLEETEGGLRVRGAAPNPASLVSWRP